MPAIRIGSIVRESAVGMCSIPFPISGLSNVVPSGTSHSIFVLAAQIDPVSWCNNFCLDMGKF